ncbi:MAG: DUF4386 domain-containing protein [Anaerolineales bacterium]
MMVTQSKPNQNTRSTAVLVGVLFLAAMVASLVGGGLVEAVIAAPDNLLNISENETQLLIGVLLELLNGIAVLGIGVLMYPILKQFNQKMAVGYLGFRIVEAVFCCMIVISPLSLITLSQEYINAGAPDVPYFQTASVMSIAGRASIANLLIPVFLSLGALLLYSVLYQSKLLPRFIAVWGLIGAILILLLNLLLTFNVELGNTAMIFALPMILNEIFLGIWLILKGFNTSVIPAKNSI